MNERVLVAFYHKGRKAFVPWLSTELARKLQRDLDLVRNDLLSLAKDGMVKTLKVHGHKHISTWELTQAGKDEARAIILAQEMVRSR